jgi:ADP-heptose:LPS heptosyltransferase
MNLMPKSYFCKKSGLKKILVIRLSSIGDIVLTSPVLRCLKQQLPGVSIHFAVKRQFLTVVASNPYIDKIHVFDGDLKAFTRELKQEQFDYIVDLHQNFRSWFIRLKLRTRSSGFPKLNFRKWLLTRLKINLMPDIHIVDRYFKAVIPLGIRNDDKGLDYFIPQDEEFDVRTLPAEFEKGYVAFVIGAKHATKRLPEKKIVAICRESGHPFVMLGGKDDAERSEAIAREAGPMVVSFCGRLSLNQSASLVRQAGAVITHDTGLMHVAAAYHKKIISVWGNTVPEFGMTPYMPENPGNSTIVEVKGLSCRPCSKLGYDRCPKKHFRCMEEVDAVKVAEAIRCLSETD